MTPMTTSTWFTLVVSFITDFIISGGGALLAGMTATQTVALPSRAVLLVGLIVGSMAGARRIQALLQVPPGASK